MQYFSDTGANLLSLEQFLYRLMNEPDYVFNAASGLCKVTVYANEYFYEQNPMQENTPKDKNLWKTFARSATYNMFVSQIEGIYHCISFACICPSRLLSLFLRNGVKQAYVA